MTKANNLTFKKTLIAVGLALASLSAAAANYYVVVPVLTGAAPTAPAITVALNSYTLPAGTVGLPYAGFDLNSLLTVTGDSSYAGTGATWQVVSGAIPAGISMSSSGQLTGTPTAAGTGSFELKATYKTASGQQSYQVVVAELQVALASTTMPAGMVGAAYNYDFKGLLAVTGDPAYTVDQASFSVASGALPPGLSLSAGGVVRGTPTTKNTAGNSFQVLATYKTKSGQQAYTIVVNEAILQVTSISAGAYHTCAVTPAGEAKCWGQNTSGQLGDGTKTQRLVPTLVQGLSNVASVYAGASRSCAITTSGAAYCWGDNTYGQLGDGTQVSTTTPVAVSGLTSGVTQLGLSLRNHTCAVVAGAAKCWGYNGNGELGNGSTSTRTTPTPVTGLTSGVTSVTAGGSHSCAIVNGAAKCWGYNSQGQLGDGTTGATYTPVSVKNLTSGVVQLSAGTAHTCAVSTAGTAYCWGSSANGQLGDGGYTSSSTPAAIIASGVASIAAGDTSTCAVTTAGAAKCWGNNYYGQLGDGTITTRTTPVSVSGLTTGVARVIVGMSHACAQLSSSIKCWGYNAMGQLGDGTTSQRTTPVAVHP